MNQHFYCVKCDKLIEIEQAAKLFRTGYFRVEYRLGCCLSCSHTDEERATDERHADDADDLVFFAPLSAMPAASPFRTPPSSR